MPDRTNLQLLGAPDITRTTNWWATHVVHHSSEHYNLTVSFRLSWVQHIKIIFFIPVALIGFLTEVKKKLSTILEKYHVQETITQEVFDSFTRSIPKKRTPSKKGWKPAQEPRLQHVRTNLQIHAP